MEYNYPPYRAELPSYETEPPGQPGIKLRPPNPAVNLFLFLATVGTTLLAGSFLEGGNPFVRIEDLAMGLPFSFTLLAIIGCHEFGHYFMCKKHGVAATLPYFIPAPPPFIIGTFGALIKIRTPIKNNRALFDIGAGGPIVGFIVAIPAIFIGLDMSEIREIDIEGSLSLGDPIIMKIISWIVFGDIPEGFDVYINPIAFAGWVGLIVTAFNLLPIGQLDGGHIAYALIGKRQAWLGYIVFFSLFPLTLFWTGWVLFIFIILFLIRVRHPTGITNLEPLDVRRKILGIVCLAMFVVCFIPIPIKGMGIMQLVLSFF